MVYFLLKYVGIFSAYSIYPPQYYYNGRFLKKNHKKEPKYHMIPVHKANDYLSEVY